MPREELVKNTAKLAIAIAWADDELSNDEVNALKDMVFSLPGLSAAEWAELEIYLESPVESSERDRLIQQTLEVIRSEKDKAYVLDSLAKLARSDGEVSATETEITSQIAASLDEVETGFRTTLKSLLGNVLKHQVANNRYGPNREERMEDYIKNTLYYNLVSELEKTGQSLQCSEQMVRKLCLAAGLMARVAWVDEDISDSEVLAIEAELVDGWSLNPGEAKILTKICISGVCKGLDYFRMTRSFYDVTDEAERRDFLRCLFRIANSAEKTSFEEIEEIRAIAGSLRVDPKEFIQAKLTIPRQDRGGL